MDKRKVIIVTDGDMVAKNAVEIAAINVGGRCLSASAGNPTILSGHEIVEMIKEVDHDPVVVMVDDRGYKGVGEGEAAMEVILHDENVQVLGVVAVSSNGKDCNGLKPSCSITKNGSIIEGAVDKNGDDVRKEEICGDTLSILRNINDLPIIGMGDPGKMNYKDEVAKGSPITTKALNEIIRRSVDMEK